MCCWDWAWTWSRCRMPYPISRTALVRLLPDWYVDAGPISLYYASNKLLPAKTRAFVDFVVQEFRTRGLATQLSAIPIRRGR